MNTDGSFIMGTGSAGIVGVVRDEQGDLLMAFSIPVQSNSNNMTEALAAKKGVQWCTQEGHNDFYLEIDSHIVANMLAMRDTNNLMLKKII